MKRFGFTLAEVLVTLGIIGVVAALTTPALIQNVGNAKVPPKLAKAKATFETAAEMMLTENSVNTIRAIAGDGAELGKELSKYMKISRSYDNITYAGYKPEDDSVSTLGIERWYRFDSDDGMTYWFCGISSPSEFPVNEDEYANIPNNQYISLVYVDVNGAEGPNKHAKDVFRFTLFNDGTLRPWGGQGFWRSGTEPPDTSELWSDNHNCDGNNVRSAATCTGSIFDNGMKIIYN